MKQLFVRILAVFLLIEAGASAKRREAQVKSGPPAVKDELFGEIDSILAELGKITGWTPKRKVPAAYISRDKLRQFVEKRMKQEIKDEDAHIEEQILQMLGLVPRSFDLRKSTVELITEQAAAFYDYNARKLFVLETNESALERRVTLAHELAHALADQRFSLRKYIRSGLQSDDMATARQAVIEGQATWLMWAYMSVRAGRPPSVPVELLANAGFTAESSGAGFPVLEDSPMYLRESLIFPYTRGLIFQNELYKTRGQKSFTEVFENPPDSSRQILHPEVWLGQQASGAKASATTQKIEAPAPDALKSYRLRAEGTIGEFDLRVLLRLYAAEAVADDLAPRWRAGAYKLYHPRGAPRGQAARPLLAFNIELDSPQAAKTLLEQYKAVLRGKDPSTKYSEETDSRLAGTNQQGKFRVWVEGSQLRSIEGI